MRTVYLGTSEFAATVLRRLADSPAPPAARRSPRPTAAAGAAAASSRRRRRASPPSSASSCCQSANVNEGEALERIRAAAPEALVVCAFGQLIREPLLGEFELLNVHPSLLPRWRGAAPIERAIMAGDERTGVCVMRLTAGLDSGPVALREEVPIGPEDDYEALAAALAERGGELLVRALDAAAAGDLEFTEQDEAAATYAEKIEPAERRLDPARPASELAAKVRALTPHVGAYLETDGGERLGVRRARAVDGRPGAGRGAGRGRRDPRRLRRRRAAARGRAAARRQADAGRRLPPRPPAAAALRERRADKIAPARSLAFAVLRETFEQGAHTERAFRAEAERRGLAGRERAQAQRLAYGAVQRRGSADAAIEELAGRSIRLLDPPVLAALRLGLYELLFADAVPDHAAVDQAVELVKAAGAGHAAGFVNAVLRRAARERERLRGAPRRRLDPGRRRGRPLGAGVAGADVVGGARRGDRAGAARRLQRAGRDRVPRRRGPARRRWRRCARPASTPRPPRAAGRWRRRRRSSSPAAPARWRRSSSPPGA